MQVLFGGEVDPSDKGHAGAGQLSNDTYCYDPSKVDIVLDAPGAATKHPGSCPYGGLQGLHGCSLCSLVAALLYGLPCMFAN